ncbi:MAG: YhgE/Pip domain-containing protein [Clostridia bacterium]|nr:YhgE/Pip domain-containing protein [Clostridia bacterium]
MKLIAIFRRDVRRITRNAMALIVAVGIAVLPALYAWFNIAANWDPYGSTSGIQVAVASEDKGCAFEGIQLNIGDQILSNLRENTQIGWRFMEKGEAISGVESGKYYACVVIPEDFSEKLSSILSDHIQRPSIEYYINEKKNAIAPKITDKGVSTIQQQINETFTGVATEAIVSGLGNATGSLSESGVSLMDRLMGTLRSADDSLAGVESSIDVFLLVSDSVGKLTGASQALVPDSSALLDRAGTTTDRVESLLSASQSASKQLVSSLDGALDTARSSAGGMKDDLVDLLNRLDARTGDAEKLRASIADMRAQLKADSAQVNHLIDDLQKLRGTLPADAVNAADDMITQLKNLNGTLSSISTLLGTAADALAKGESVAESQLAELQKLTAGALDAVHTMQGAAAFLPAGIRDALSKLDASLTGLSGFLNDGSQLAALKASAVELEASLRSVREQLNTTADENKVLIARLTALKKTLPGDITSGIDSLTGTLGSLGDTLDLLRNGLGDLDQVIAGGAPLPAELRDRLVQSAGAVSADLDSAHSAAKAAEPYLDEAVDQTFATLDSTSSLLALFSGTMPQLSHVLDSMGGAVDSASQALQTTKGLISGTRGDLGKLLGKLESVEEDDRLKTLVDFLQNDSTLMGDFMSSPVQVETHSFYAIKNYGSAMAAFYSTLAFWVGGVVLVAILKVRVDEDDVIRDLKPWEAYLGRYLLFLLFGLAQSSIICLGDVYFLGVQCTNVFLFLLSGWVSGFVFTLIIYTLTVSFGDVGKALAVILLVIQIAGAGGTFPIEVTPPFFQGVYPFLPFTYGINAMREIIAGQYAWAYWIDLGKLLLFVPVALLLGLVLRKPLIKMNRFFEERLESTHLM